MVEILACAETAELVAVQCSAVGGLWRPALRLYRPSGVRSEMMAGRVSIRMSADRNSEASEFFRIDDTVLLAR